MFKGNNVRELFVYFCAQSDSSKDGLVLDYDLRKGVMWFVHSLATSSMADIP
jgi:hypothetical protein